MDAPVTAAEAEATTTPAATPDPTPVPTGWPAMTYWARLTLTVVGVLFGCYIAYRLRAVAVSVAFALFLAVGLEPAIAAMERRGIRRGFAVLLLLLGLLAVVAGSLLLAIPPAVRQFSELVSQIPRYFQELTAANPKINELINGPELQGQLSSALGKVPSLLGTSLSRIFGVASAVVGALFTALTVLVLMIYFQLALPKLRGHAERMLVSPGRVALLRDVLGKISGYVVGQLSICFIAGFLAFLFLTAIHAPFPVLLGLLTSLTAAVPLSGRRSALSS